MPTDPNWWVSSVLTLIGIIIGALGIIWQMGRQHRSSLEVQRAGMRNELKLEIYREIAGGILEAQNAIARVVDHVAGHMLCLQADVPLPDIREWYNMHCDAHSHVLSVVALIEKWEIVFLGFAVIKREIMEKLGEFMTASDSLFAEIAPCFTENGAACCDKVKLAAVMKRFDPYQALRSDLLAFLHDLRVEIQNRLLVGIFNERVPKRVPLDPAFKVLAPDDQPEQ